MFRDWFHKYKIQYIMQFNHYLMGHQDICLYENKYLTLTFLSSIVLGSPLTIGEMCTMNENKTYSAHPSKRLK